MKHILLYMSLMLISIRTVSAQSRTYSGDSGPLTTFTRLHGTWDYTKCDTNFYIKQWTFSDSIMILSTKYVEYPEYSHAEDYLYYISDFLPAEFEHSRVGKNVSGKYIIYQRILGKKYYNYGYYRLDKFENGDIQMFMKGVKDSPFFMDHDIYLRKTEYVNSRGTYSGSGSRNDWFGGSSSGSSGGFSRGSGGGRR